MVCGAMIGVAYIGGSFANTDVQLAWLFVLFAGVGLGVSNVLAKEAVGRRFTKNYATASGIARTGYAVGLLVFAPLIQLFLNTYGWRGTMMLMGGVSLHLVVCGAVLTTSGKVTPQQTMYHQVSDQENSTSTVSQNTLAHRCSGVRENLCKNLDMRLLGIGHFWAPAVMMCCTIFADDMWIIYFVSQAQSNGFTAEQAGSFVSMASVGGVIGKVVQGLLTDCGVISSWSLTAMSIILSSAGYCSTPLLTSYWASAATAFLILCSSGVLACQVDVFIKQVMGVELLAGAFAWVGLLTAGMSFFAGFLPGLLYDLAGSYTAAFLIVGAVQGIPLIPLAILRYSYGRVESAE
ncbi:monocarboxylate transporter 12-like [Acanthaster planci]|uniref:Monocarboxylate transporter 12-like n=1 Tax=Acanthaster planci TaxID=133434 RepID=A0A8B7YW05_ACAPL|nr:monocarboxylate transporter 12-like [Acanthaster planci]